MSFCIIVTSSFNASLSPAIDCLTSASVCNASCVIYTVRQEQSNCVTRIIFFLEVWRPQTYPMGFNWLPTVHKKALQTIDLQGQNFRGAEGIAYAAARRSQMGGPTIHFTRFALRTDISVFPLCPNKFSKAPKRKCPPERRANILWS